MIPYFTRDIVSHFFHYHSNYDMPVIQLKNLSKTYTSDAIEVHAVRNVTLNFGEGEFTAIAGASGSGKTTLLNMIGGIDTPSTGEVWVGPKNIGAMNDKERTAFRRDTIGFVFQSYNLLPVLTAAENVGFIMELQKRPKRETEERSFELLSAIGLSDKLNVRPNKLSGGQQQRVAVARALAHRPKFVIADEPTANLDSASAAGLLDMMQMLNRTEGITFIFSTHDQRVIDRAQRVITFGDGQVQNDEQHDETRNLPQ